MVQFGKLTRNLFLTLHGHNVHRQQRQLSTFLVRYQQFAFHAYCGTAGLVSKMVYTLYITMQGPQNVKITLMHFSNGQYKTPICTTKNTPFLQT
jgi:hypothetical protein